MLEKQILCGLGILAASAAVANADGVFVLNDTCAAFRFELTEDNAHQDSFPDGFSNDNLAVGTDGVAHTACVDGSNDEQIYNDVWFLLPSADFDGILSVSLAGSNFDTKLAVYDVTGLPTIDQCMATDANLVACNDDCGGGQTSGVAFSTVTGGSYLLRIGGESGAKGTILITFSRPEALLNELIDDVQALDDTGGPLDGGQVNSLTKKLDSAKAQLSMGKTTPAINKLQAFINEVDALLGSGTLTAAQATDLKSKANQLIAANSC
jgi:hypothetical protein